MVDNVGHGAEHVWPAAAIVLPSPSQPLAPEPTPRPVQGFLRACAGRPQMDQAPADHPRGKAAEVADWQGLCPPAARPRRWPSGRGWPPWVQTWGSQAMAVSGPCMPCDKTSRRCGLGCTRAVRLPLQNLSSGQVNPMLAWADGRAAWPRAGKSGMMKFHRALGAGQLPQMVVDAWAAASRLEHGRPGRRGRIRQMATVLKGCLGLSGPGAGPWQPRCRKNPAKRAIIVHSLAALQEPPLCHLGCTGGTAADLARHLTGPGRGAGPAGHRAMPPWGVGH
jgi:hypothetical protein